MIVKPDRQFVKYEVTRGQIIGHIRNLRYTFTEYSDHSFVPIAALMLP